MFKYQTRTKSELFVSQKVWISAFDHATSTFEIHTAQLTKIQMLSQVISSFQGYTFLYKTVQTKVLFYIIRHSEFGQLGPVQCQNPNQVSSLDTELQQLLEFLAKKIISSNTDFSPNFIFIVFKPKQNANYKLKSQFSLASTCITYSFTKGYNL